MTDSGSERKKLTRSQVAARAAVITSIVFIIGMWVYAFGGFASRQAAAKIDDTQWTKRAEQICVQRNALLAKNAEEVRKTSDGSPQAVGKGVTAATDLIEAALDEMMATKPSSAQDTKLVDQFEALYRTYIADRRATEAKLAEGEKAELNETMLNGAPLSDTIGDFTKPNKMDSCAVPVQF